jgi:hypothetical protein
MLTFFREGRVDVLKHLEAQIRGTQRGTESKCITFGSVSGHAASPPTLINTIATLLGLSL